MDAKNEILHRVLSCQNQTSVLLSGVFIDGIFERVIIIMSSSIHLSNSVDLNSAIIFTENVICVIINNIRFSRFQLG